MKYKYTIILSLIYFSPATALEHKAVINIPLADLIGQQITTIFPDISAEQAYNTIPVCAGEILSPLACPRLHQLLYNDIVTVIKIVNDEACIQISHAYCKITPSEPLHTTYWILKKNLTFFDDFLKQGIDSKCIPNAIDFSDNNNSAFHCTDIITLIAPHQDSTLRMTFSAGTRFIKTSSTPKKRAYAIEAYAIDYEKMKVHKIKIPIDKCVFGENTKTPQERVTNFVTLLKKWAHQKNGFIPYVWGGTSFTKLVHTDFKEITKTGPQGDYSFYEYEKDTQSPKNGFDCSGMVLRAAQICGIPYFCKNTTTIMQCLSALKCDEQLQEGDLILIKGHVMVVSDINRNLLIEARSYGHGYGKIQEIPINQVFDGIETYKDLLDAYHEKKVIKRKDKNGKIRDTFSNLQLFPMMSCME